VRRAIAIGHVDAGRTIGASERSLMWAVLRTVFDDCPAASIHRAVGHRPPSAVEVRRARAYVVSTDRDWPYSFENLCEALGLDARCTRRALQID
jgi:hypothetical protein